MACPRRRRPRAEPGEEPAQAAAARPGPGDKHTCRTGKPPVKIVLPRTGAFLPRPHEAAKAEGPGRAGVRLRTRSSCCVVGQGVHRPAVYIERCALRWRSTACAVGGPASDWRPECKLNDEMRSATQIQHIRQAGRGAGALNAAAGLHQEAPQVSGHRHGRAPAHSKARGGRLRASSSARIRAQGSLSPSFLQAVWSCAPRPRPLTHTHTQTHSHSHTPTQPHPHTRTPTPTHSHTHTHTRTHTPTHSLTTTHTGPHLLAAWLSP